jgi:hypothetical protein
MVTGPKPLYQPRFTEAHLAEARRVAASHTAGYLRVLRAQMVLHLAAGPSISTPELARRVGVHLQTARKWRKRWATEGFTLDDHPRSGHPPRFSPPAGDRGEGDRV